MFRTILYAHQPVLRALWFESFPRAVYATHADTCPKKGAPKGKNPGCPSDGTGSVASKGGGAAAKALLVRGKPPKVRMGFLPENWFTFMQQKTGVSGPYVLAFVFANYCLSKEIYVLEHEYYSGLSWIVIIVGVYQKFGTTIAAALDKQVDAVSAEWESGRTMEKNIYNEMIKDAKDAQFRAEGQKLLMDAKKENILMQLEAAYRERAMLAYRTVTGRMEYHMKRYATEARIQQKWMVGWILQNVHSAITPDFKKRALQSAIDELGSLASKA